jgi:hypothetical protein
VASDSLELAKLLLSNLVHEVYNVFGGGAVNVAGTFESFGRLLPVSFLEVPSRESVVLQQRQEGHAKIDAFFNTNFSYKYDPDYQPFIRTVMLEMPLPGPALFGRARFIPLKGARVRTVAAGAMDRAVVLQEARPLPKNVSISVKDSVAYNRAAFEEYKTGLRSQMEKPHVVDPGLTKIIDSIYKPHAKIGSGSTAAAIRLEKMTGNPLYGKMHFKKGNESIIRLEKWLKQNPSASVGDRAAAENIIKDLQNSLK